MNLHLFEFRISHVSMETGGGARGVHPLRMPIRLMMIKAPPPSFSCGLFSCQHVMGKAKLAPSAELKATGRLLVCSQSVL